MNIPRRVLSGTTYFIRRPAHTLAGPLTTKAIVRMIEYGIFNYASTLDVGVHQYRIDDKMLRVIVTDYDNDITNFEMRLFGFTGQVLTRHTGPGSIWAPKHDHFRKELCDAPTILNRMAHLSLHSSPAGMTESPPVSRSVVGDFSQFTSPRRISRPSSLTKRTKMRKRPWNTLVAPPAFEHLPIQDFVDCLERRTTLFLPGLEAREPASSSPQTEACDVADAPSAPTQDDDRPECPEERHDDDHDSRPEASNPQPSVVDETQRSAEPQEAGEAQAIDVSTCIPDPVTCVHGVPARNDVQRELRDSDPLAALALGAGDVSSDVIAQLPCASKLDSETLSAVIENARQIALRSQVVRVISDDPDTELRERAHLAGFLIEYKIKRILLLRGDSSVVFPAGTNWLHVRAGCLRLERARGRPVPYDEASDPWWNATREELDALIYRIATQTCGDDVLAS